MSNRLLIACADSVRLRAYERAVREVVPAVLSASTFDTAISLLFEERPDVLLTEFRLQDFNGFDLALHARARLSGVRTIVVGALDHNMKQDLKSIGAYSVPPEDMERIIDAVREAVAREHPRRQWSRRPPQDTLTLEVDGHLANVVDMSYGGVRIETRERPADMARANVWLSIPPRGLREPATRVWTRFAGPDSYICGIALAEDQTAAGSGWRALVKEFEAHT